MLSPDDCYSWQPQWSGKISASLYTTNAAVSHGFVYRYDNLGRLTKSYFGEGSEIELDDAEYTETFKYDAMGNVTRLTRYGLTDDDSYNPVDGLRMTYEGNRLVKVTDIETDNDPTYEGVMQFTDNVDLAVEYEYDENGNMTKDLNRKISRIEYNSLNLPESTVIQGDGEITYINNTYDSDLFTRHRTPMNVGGEFWKGLDRKKVQSSQFVDSPNKEKVKDEKNVF